MIAPSGRNIERDGDRQRDGFDRLVEFFRDRRQGERNEKEVERVECPAEEAGGDRGAMSVGGR